MRFALFLGCNIPVRLKHYESASRAVLRELDVELVDIAEFNCDGEIWIAKALVDCNIEPSTSQARRDIKQGAVKIDQIKISDEQLQLSSGEYVLQVGKRKFAKLKVN